MISIRVDMNRGVGTVLPACIVRKKSNLFSAIQLMKEIPLNKSIRVLYPTLKDLYRKIGFPTELIRSDFEFTIFNLAHLKLPLPFSMPVSRLNFFVFVFLKKAQGWCMVDDHKIQLEPGMIYFISPCHYRSFGYHSLEEVYVITLTENFLTENVRSDIFEDFSFLTTEPFLAVTSPPDLFAAFEKIYLQIQEVYVSKSSLKEQIISHLFVAILYKLKEHFWFGRIDSHESNRHSVIVKKFKQDLEKHYRDIRCGGIEQVFRVQEYADLQHLHPNYLSNIIKTETGKTIGTWIAEKNVAEAKSLLRHSTISVKEIAYSLGFLERAHFCNYFKKQTGVSPSLYRKNHPSEIAS